jgi:hypothetical protein
VDGTFALEGLLERGYQVLAFDPPSVTRAGPWKLAAPARGLELVLPAEASTARVAGRVVSATGAPIAGVSISAQRTNDALMEGLDPAYAQLLRNNAYSQPPQTLLHRVTTDAEGRFAFEGLAVEGTELVLNHDRLLIRSVTLDPRADLAHLELVEPLQCELQVDTTVDPALADEVAVLDEAGTELETIESFGNGFSLGTRASFAKGLTSVLSVRETAHTLVLYKAGNEVLRRQITLDPEQRTTVRF